MRDKIQLFHKVGGHPKTIELLNGWLATEEIGDLMADPRLDDMLTAQWEDYFLRDLLAQLPPEEHRRLNRLAIFQAALSDEALQYAGIDAAMAGRWLDLSLLQREAGGGARHSIHPVVADYLLGQTTAIDRRDLHRWAAAFYSQPFVKMARDYVARTGQTATDEQLEWFARIRDGVVGQLVAQTKDMGQARGAMERALAWQRHLFAAGDVDAAGNIVTAVLPTLDRWGERDRAKGLLRRSITSLEEDEHSFAKAVAQSNLATILKDEGKLDEALATYQDVYETFAELDAKQQMAGVLSSMAAVHMNQGNIDEAIEYEERSMVLSKEHGSEEGQAINLHQLSMMYRMKEAYETALARSKAAEALARKVRNQAGLAATLHEQGMIYNRMAWEAVPTQAQKYGKTAVARFQSSLAITRRIGDESGTANTLGELGKLLGDARQMDDAIAAFNEALAIDRRLNRPVAVAMDLEFLGTVHERQEQYAAALSKYQEALALFQQYGSPQNIAIAQNLIARVSGKM